MEGRANSRNYSPPDPMSRVRQDLNGHHSNRDSSPHGDVGPMLRKVMPKGRKPRVCVVGAGAAGLRCAQVLGQKDIDVTILEARDRTGRAFNKHSGPNWFHGINGNPILDLARELGAIAMSVPELPPSIYDQVGRLLGKEESQQCFELFWGIIEEAFQYSNKESASIPQDQSLLDFFKIKVQEKNLSEPIKKRVLDLCESWGDYIGGTIDRQSLKYFFLEETVDEGNLFLASTYRAVLDRITKDTYAQANIQLSTKVTSTAPPE
ncbi:MAG: hypothetical protein Q9179_007691 [Wetmoreana sp. 5 TL-2023]